jgi:hypothetical protein
LTGETPRALDGQNRYPNRFGWLCGNLLAASNSYRFFFFFAIRTPKPPKPGLSALLLSESHADPAQVIFISECNACFLEGCLQPKYGRHVAHNWARLSFDPPNSGYSHISRSSEVILPPVQ